MVSYPGQVNGNLTATGTITSSPAGVLDLGPDVNAYRLGAGQLATDNTFTLFGAGAKALDVATVGAGLAVAEGSNARMGTLTLNGATPVVVANASITANTRIFLTANAPGGTPGHFWVSARSAGVSFSVTGTAGDTSTVAYLLVEPA
jgi:hypothetical protein